MFNPLILLLLFAIPLYVIVTWYYNKAMDTCPKYKYVYKPANRTFIEEENNPISVYKLYQNMFFQPSLPTSKGYTGNFTPITGTINPYIHGGIPTTETGMVKESNNFLNQGA